MIHHVLKFYLNRSRAKGISVRVDSERLRPSDVMVLRTTLAASSFHLMTTIWNG
jgi:hypothetical protein